MAKCDLPCWQQWPKLQVPCSPQLCRIQKVHDRPSPTICNNLRLYSTGISPLAALAFHSHLLSMTHMSCILVVTVDVTSHNHSHQDGWHQDVDRIWHSLAMCKPNTSSYPQLRQMMSFQGAVALRDSVVHYQTICQDQQLILVATWSCPTWVLHPSPFSDIFWAWCTCHVSGSWSHVAHRPSKNVKVISSPSLGFVFHHSVSNMRAWFFCFSHLQVVDSTFWWVAFEMAEAS